MPSGPASASTNFSGPFFTRDPEKTITENVHKMMLAIAEEGATAARTSMRQGEGQRDLVRELGVRASDYVVGRVKSRAGTPWLRAAVVQVLNEGLSAGEGRSLMAAASAVEGETHTFRNIARQLRSARAVLRANLTEGIE